MTYKQILVPDKKNHTIEMPKEFFGKKVEVTVVEMISSAPDTYPVAPVGKRLKRMSCLRVLDWLLIFHRLMRLEVKHGLPNGNF